LWDFTGEIISKLVDFHGNIIFFHGECCPKWAVVFQVVAGRVGDSFIWVIFYLIEFLELLVTMLLVSRRNQ